jgi:hypothetical protein
MKKQNKGITLIVLVLMIVILLILGRNINFSSNWKKRNNKKSTKS